MAEHASGWVDIEAPTIENVAVKMNIMTKTLYGRYRIQSKCNVIACIVKGVLLHNQRDEFLSKYIIQPTFSFV